MALQPGLLTFDAMEGSGFLQAATVYSMPTDGGAGRYGFEIKRTAPPVDVVDTLNLERLDVVHAGTHRRSMAPRVRAVPAAQLSIELRPLRG